MKLKLKKNSEELGKEAASHCAKVLNTSIAIKGKARLAVSTGASQFDLLKALIHENVDFSRVEMFHLDEYIGLPKSHPASFRKYLKERFTSFVNFKAIHYVNGEGDVQSEIMNLTNEIRKESIDLGLIGIGENAHIAFNDPPADFSTKEAYIIVDLDEQCKNQQVREGWFQTDKDVPQQAISMSVYQIMQCETIISFVPYKVKAEAIKLTMENDVTNTIPSTILKKHKDVTLYLDEDSASLLTHEIISKYQ